MVDKWKASAGQDKTLNNCPGCFYWKFINKVQDIYTFNLKECVFFCVCVKHYLFVNVESFLVRLQDLLLTLSRPSQDLLRTGVVPRRSSLVSEALVKAEINVRWHLLDVIKGRDMTLITLSSAFQLQLTSFAFFSFLFFDFPSFCLFVSSFFSHETELIQELFHWPHTLEDQIVSLCVQ